MRLDDTIRNNTGRKYRKERKRKDNKSTARKFAKLQLVPGSHGMNVPSTCTIVIIAGK